MTDETSGRTPATSSDAPGSGLEALTEEALPALIARLRASRLGELEVRTADWRVRLRRDANASVRATAAGAVHASAEEPEGLGVSIARSSAVGYFKPAPDLVARLCRQVAGEQGAHGNCLFHGRRGRAIFSIRSYLGRDRTQSRASL